MQDIFLSILGKMGFFRIYGKEILILANTGFLVTDICEAIPILLAILFTI